AGDAGSRRRGGGRGGGEAVGGAGEPGRGGHPAPAGRRAGGGRGGETARGRAAAARARHSSVDLGFTVVERDSDIGGALLARALAYPVFVPPLPPALLPLPRVGVLAGAAGTSTAGGAPGGRMHGGLGSRAASAASGRGRALLFILMIPVVLYATTTLYRALAKVHALVWEGSARGVRFAPRGVVALLGALAVQFAAVEVVGWIRRNDQFGGIA